MLLIALSFNAYIHQLIDFRKLRVDNYSKFQNLYQTDGCFHEGIFHVYSFAQFICQNCLGTKIGKVGIRQF